MGQFWMDTVDPCSENEMSDSELALHRANQGLFRIVSVDTSDASTFRDVWVHPTDDEVARVFIKLLRGGLKVPQDKKSAKSLKRMGPFILIDVLLAIVQNSLGDQTPEAGFPNNIHPRTWPTIFKILKSPFIVNAPYNFHLYFEAREIRQDITVVYEEEWGPWELHGSIFYNNRWTSDEIEIRLLISHKGQCDDEELNRHVFAISKDISASTYGAGIHPIPLLAQSGRHNNHVDDLEPGKAKIIVDGSNDHITFFDLELKGSHIGRDTSTTVCAGTTLELSSEIDTIGTYSWTSPTGQIYNLQYPTLQNANPSMNGTYVVHINPVNGCEFTDTIEVTVVDQVQAIAGVSDTIIFIGDDVYLQGHTNSLFGSTPVTTTNVWWDSAFISNDDTVLITPTSTQTYYYSAVNLQGSCGDTASVTIQVREQDTLDLSSGTGDWLICEEAGVAVVPPRQTYQIAPSIYWPTVNWGTSWLSDNPNGTNISQVGQFVYKQTINIAKVDTTIRMVVNVMADDSVTVLFNGHVIVPYQHGYLAPIQVSISDPNLFNVGSNLMEVIVWNAIGPHGFNIQAVITSDSILIPIIPGLADWNANAQVDLFPNPASEEIHLEGLPKNRKFNYSVFDAQGKRLLQTDELPIRIQALKPGMYFLEVRDRSGLQPHYFRFVRQ